MSNWVHAVLILLTCGLWLPIWILCVLWALIPPAQCSVCSTLLRKSSHIWIIEGKKQWLCPKCNQSMERRKSRGAMNKRFGR